MFLEDRIKCFAGLGERLKNLTPDEMEEVWRSAQNQNSWFTEESVRNAINGIILFLDQKTLENWLKNYDLDITEPKKIGVIAAGNIPIVGFHDLLCVLMSGHHLLLKPSSDDSFLMHFIRKELIHINPAIESRFTIVERLNDADAFITTGSDNSARYFKYYFKEKPNVIRANRTSVAVLDGSETAQQLKTLGKDIFQYYGLGCRNVSKVYVPLDYDLSMLLDQLQSYANVADHHKYNNNYDYNKSIYLVNGEPHLDNGFLLIRESEQLVSPISVLFYERYDTEASIEKILELNEAKIQCVVGNGYVDFGNAQCPLVSEYADGVDTLDFLQKLA